MYRNDYDVGYYWYLCDLFEKVWIPFYEKPVAQQIEKFTKKDPDAKWIVLGGTTISSFITMCGAKTINFVNFYPNMELWEKLDVNHQLPENLQ